MGMRAHLVLLGSLVLFGCGEVAGPMGAWVEADPEELLEDGVGEWVPERAGLVDYGRARLTAAGPALRPTGAPPESRSYDPTRTIRDGMVVVDDRAGLRVISHDSEVRLLLWLDEADFATVVYAPAWARAVPDGLAAPGIGARLTAGLPVEELDADGEQTLIRWAGTKLEVEAWLPEEHVRGYFRDVEDDFEATPANGRAGLLPPGTELLDLPFGEPFAVVVDPKEGNDRSRAVEGPLRVERVGEPEDGHQRVQGTDGGVLVRGWVAVEEIEESPLWCLGMSGGSSWGCSSCGGHSGPATLHADALVTDAPDGEVVGRTLREGYRMPLRMDEATGAVAFAVSTAWGAGEVWADPADVTDAGWELLE